LSASAAELGGVGDGYARRRPDNAKMGLGGFGMGRTWRRRKSRDVVRTRAERETGVK